MNGMYGIKNLKVDQMSRISLGIFKGEIGQCAVIIDNGNGTYSIYNRDTLDNYFEQIKNNIEGNENALFMIHKLYMNCIPMAVDKSSRVSIPREYAENLSDEVIILGEGDSILLFPSVEAFMEFKNSVDQAVEEPVKLSKLLNL